MRPLRLAIPLLGAASLLSFASPAAAQTNWTLSLGGYYYGVGIARRQDNPAGVDVRNYDFNQYGVYTFSAENALENGLTIGFTNGFEMDSSFSTDTSQIFAEGGFGRAEFGSDWSAAYNSHLFPPTAGWSIDDPDQADVFLPTNDLASPAGNQVPATSPYLSNKYMKVTYYTPRFAGLQLGASFTPDTRSADGASGPYVGQNNRFITDETQLDQLKNVISLAASYQAELDDVGLALAATLETGETTQLLRDATVDSASRRNGYNLSALVETSGVSLGAAYGYDDFGLENYRQHNVAAGLTYSFGPWTVGPAFSGIIETGSGSEKRKTYMAEWGTTYRLAEGIDLIGSVWYARFRRGNDSAAENGDGLAGLFGINLNF